METPAARPASLVVEPRHGGQILVDALLAHGVDMAFGVPGESYLSVLEGFYQRRDRARFIVCRQEGGAANMADAYGKLTGRPGIVFCTRGPGATNASIGVHTAFQDSTPLILFIGQVGRDFVDREAFQEIDYRRMFGQMAKWVAQIDSVERIPEYIARAFQTATAGRPGPVVLALPEDMLTDVATVADVPPEVATKARAMAWPSPHDLARLKTLLQDAERPMLLLGGSGWTPQAAARMQAFAERWNLPAGCVFRRQDLFDNRHPNYAGDVGIAINPKLAARVKDADVVLAIGTRLGEMTTSGYTLFDVPRPKQTLVHVHAGAEELGRVYQADLMIHASMPAIAEALDGVSPDAPPRWSAWTEAANADYRANIVPPPFGGKGIDMARAMQWLRERLPRHSILTNGAGNYATWLHRFYQYGALAAGSRTQLAPTSGAMGYGAPAAVAAKIVSPDTPVVGFAGDGAFGISMSEMTSCGREEWPGITMVIFRNYQWGAEKRNSILWYDNNFVGTELDPNLSFAKVAEGCGLKGVAVTTQTELTEALKEACETQKEGVTTFIEVVLNQELGEPFRRDAMTAPVEVAGIDPNDMKPQQPV